QRTALEHHRHGSWVKFGISAPERRSICPRTRRWNGWRLGAGSDHLSLQWHGPNPRRRRHPEAGHASDRSGSGRADAGPQGSRADGRRHDGSGGTAMIVRRSVRRGISVLEVLTALAIFMLSIVVISQMVDSAARTAMRSKRLTQAGIYC